MKRLATTCAVILIGLGVGTAVAQPPLPYGPVPSRATRRFLRRAAATTGSRDTGTGTAIVMSGSAGTGWRAGRAMAIGRPVTGRGMAIAGSGTRRTGSRSAQLHQHRDVIGGLRLRAFLAVGGGGDQALGERRATAGRGRCAGRSRAARRRPGSPRTCRRAPCGCTARTASVRPCHSRRRKRARHFRADQRVGGGERAGGEVRRRWGRR